MKFFTPSFLKECKSIILIILFAFSIRILIFEPYFIPSTSMYSNLKVGDYIFATKYNYGYSKYSLPFWPNIFSSRIFASEPQRGDIVIFVAKNTGINERFIKRLIGLPGDKIQFKKGDLYLNDQKLVKQYIEEITNEQQEEFAKFREYLPNGRSYNILKSMSHATNNLEAENSRIYYVPENHYFFLGDNRDQSGDSRFKMGYITNQELIAKAQFIYFAADKTLLLTNNFSIKDQFFNIWYWIKSIRVDRIFRYLY